MPGGSPDRITIVIPHLHQWRQLDDCLASLHSQTLPRDRYDIIVVDNGSTDFETGRQNVSRRYPDVRMVSERERSEEHTSELQSLMRISSAVFCLQKKKSINTKKITTNQSKT